MYSGAPAIIDVNTPPSPMDITRQPNVQLSSLPALSWNPMEDPPTDLPQYHALIKSYLLLLLSSKGDQGTNSNLGSLLPILESKIGSGFKVLWYKQIGDEEAFKQPIKVENLEPRKQYQLAWVQVSQYNNAYGIDYILSNHFVAL
ncbi:hypothetical protein J6590_108475 [Homalodisca vitripennis]|nr:hypothetical protein J6590_108475 [Homalodisca vitripennis]